MIRDIISIDESQCNGCGNCVPGCPEGAIQIINGKARLVSDLFCDGLGACIGECQTGALKIERREAESYSEEKAIANVAAGGPDVIKAHLKHLHEHGEHGFLDIAVSWLKQNGIKVPEYKGAHSGGCPGSVARRLKHRSRPAGTESGNQVSALANWPIQLALINPENPQFKNADILLAADCTAFASANLHSDFLAGKALIIMCPKLDDRISSYKEKLVRLLKNGVKSVTVLRMMVPCCAIDTILKQALDESGLSVPVSVETLSLEGELI